MGRIRSIKPELLEDEKAGRLDDLTWRLFVSMFLLADDYGNLRGDPGWLQGQVFWSREDSRKSRESVANAISSLVSTGMIRQYQVRGQFYLSITNWHKHQKVDHPGNPHVPGELESDPGNTLNTSRDVREDSRKSRESLAPDQDQDQYQDQDLIASSAKRSQPTSPAVISIPTLGEPLEVTEADLGEWESAFPAVDVRQALNNMRQWVLANPTKRKTPRGVRRFVVRWLTKDQDKGGNKPKTESKKQELPPYYHEFTKEELDALR